MDLHQPRTNSGNYEDHHVGIPEDLRCKRSDGKQWRCSAMSMPDKTVCEKHYIQAKKRAANSALRASMKKAKRQSYGESDDYLDGRNDEEDTPPPMNVVGEFAGNVSGKKHKDKGLKNYVKYTSESPPLRTSFNHSPLAFNDDVQRDGMQVDEEWKSSYKSPPASGVDSERNKARANFDAGGLEEQSDASTDSSYEAGGLTCHQCRRNDKPRVVWCLRCDKRGYCDGCLSEWYPNIPLDEIQKVCPACRGECNCKVCLRGDNLIKARMRDVGSLEKLRYLYNLLSSILPVIKRIHFDQCFELELETKLHGTKADIPRAKLNADEQMCCNCCRIPIIDYHRHCTNCLYDLCLTCCRDLRHESLVGDEGEQTDDQMPGGSQELACATEKLKLSGTKLNLADQYPDWKANGDGGIPCPPNQYSGCGCPSLSLRRIFKLNWVAKLVKNVEEMVNGCRVYEESQQYDGLNDYKLCQFSHREESNDNVLYCPASQDIKLEGLTSFQKHWVRGEPVIVKEVCDCTLSSSWDPMTIWRGIRETTEEKSKDDTRTVKAIDCLNCSEVDIELGQFIKGYSEGRIHEDGWPEMLQLKDWPTPSASEEFLLYQRPELISKVPFLEYVHSKWGLLNVAAKLPHYSLQNDVGPKIFISYGTYEELGRGDSVTNLHTSMRDMVYLLMHTFEVKLKGWQRTKIEKIQRALRETQAIDSLGDPQISLGESAKSPDLSPIECGKQNECSSGSTMVKDEIMEDQVLRGTETTAGCERKEIVSERPDNDNEDVLENAPVGAIWDVFRRQDVPKLFEFLTAHWKEFRQHASLPNDSVVNPLYDKAVFLNRDHKRKLKEEFKVEPWTFEQRLGEAVFIPAGCPFQVRNLQSSVQLALDFLSPESLGESVRLAEEIRCLPNDHEAKLHTLEVGKMSLYAASSAIREVQKLALDPKSGLGFEDPNLTAMVSKNLEKLIRRRQIACI